MSDDRELLAAIFEFRTTLPGWWFCIGECSVSCDATVGPEAAFIPEPMLSVFDAGFDCDLRQPSTLAEALRGATSLAAQAVEEYKAKADASEIACNLLPQFVRALRLIDKEPAQQLTLNPLATLQSMRSIGLVKVAAEHMTPQGRSETIVLSALGRAVLVLIAPEPVA